MAIAALVVAAIVGQVQVESWPACGVGAISVAARIPEAVLSPTEGHAIVALTMEAVRQAMAASLDDEEGPGGKLRAFMPAESGIALTRRREYVAVTVAFTPGGEEYAIGWLEWVLKGMNLRRANLARVRAVLGERYKRWKDELLEPTLELFLQAAYGKSGVTGPYYGRPETWKSISAAKLEEARREIFCRGNVAICAVVPFSGRRLEEIRQRLEDLWQSLDEAGASGGGQEQGQQAAERVRFEENRAINRALLVVGGPLRGWGGPEFWAGALVRELLAGPEGLIYEHRAVSRMIGLAVPGNYPWQRWPIQALPVPLARHAYVAMHVICAPAYIDRARRLVVSILDEVASGGFSPGDLARARARVANLFARETDTPRQRAEKAAIAAVLGARLPDADELSQQLDMIPASAVEEAAQKLLDQLAVGLQMPPE